MIDKTDVDQPHDDWDGETVIKWRTRRLIRHRKDTEEFSTLFDLKVQNILYKGIYTNQRYESLLASLR